MYAWFYRHVLFGPNWLRIIESLFLLYLLTIVLFLWVYPWAFTTFGLNDNNIG
ncbi:hypothetical protein [Boudabousia marimammalium]|uniref:hypothetical protein n=1 Tax=Boudabousia marimammalium TaxID=156892 RepID=UPI000AC0BDE5|nr:hypothetical protein [Boudabousia marimammalium]